MGTAAVILSAGTKGQRAALPHSSIVLHQPRSGAQGQATDIQIRAKEVLHNKQAMLEILSNNTGRSVEELSKNSDRMSYLTPYEAVEFGLIDRVLSSLVAQMLYLDSEDSSKPIYLYINSPGGSVTAGLAIFDTIQYVKSEVVTICVGLAASMGAFLLAAGTKGKRVALPHSRIMIHQPLGGTSRRQASDIEIEAREILRMKDMLNHSLADMSGQTFEKIEKDTDRDYFLSAQEAKDYGLIDRVISHPNEA